ncbi:MAG: DoxX family protein [Flavobacteriales bacterium]|nr:DoxX family protein [Flavobacteriales bacterium]MBP9079658.1 DoxX family protein [Flavobacteriales bacterium]
MRIFLLICRVLVGATFIISGLIKANDPLGFSYKLEEYFAESALGLPWLEPYALPLAMLACLAEVVLGFAVLVGGRMKLATWSLLALTLFFGWLTAYTATCDPFGKYEVLVGGVAEQRDVTCVTDCGCFGDAMKGSLGRSLTPWESFTKDMVLLVFVLPLFFFRKRIKFNTWGDDLVLLPMALALLAFYCWVFTWWFPLLFTVLVLAGYLLVKRFVEEPRGEWATAGWVAAATVLFMGCTLAYMPLRDYRPYAVGKNITQQKLEAKPPVNLTYVSYRNKTTGEAKEYLTSGPYPWDDPNFENVPNSTRVVEVEPGIASQVQDFILYDADGEDYTDTVLTAPEPVLLVVAKTIGDTRTRCQPAINALAVAAQKAGWRVYGLTSSSYDESEAFRHANQNMFDYLTCDEVTLKTVVRSNPGVVLLQQGTVRGKWGCNSVPSFAKAAKALK